ncbi:thiamine biosynthesis lipoprotein [Undibacterium sp. GrIS 1.2]|uniref:FAD:protein FMN transferase n=1 Tax=Undibacterium sp. GrIS 1.2 TaxID=3143933 RepID=UPI00339B5B21
MTHVFIPTHMTMPAASPVGSYTEDFSGATMGTTWAVKLVRPQYISAVQLQNGMQQALDKVVAQMSTWLADSDISRFNQAAAGSWHVLPPEFFKVLDYGLFIAQQTSGAYDPSIGHLVNVWGFGPDKNAGQIPSKEVLEQARRQSGYQKLQVDRLKQNVYQPGGLSIDLSSIAKGFGVDQVARYLEAQGILSYLVEVGGELRGLGTKPDNTPWWVELEQVQTQTEAQTQTTSTASIVALHGLSIATSGDYRRYFDYEGQRFSHTIDPCTGYPVTHNLAAVTVLHAECMIADALATAMTVMGLTLGMAYANQLHVAALFVCRGAATTHGDQPAFTEHMSKALMAMLEE